MVISVNEGNEGEYEEGFLRDLNVVKKECCKREKNYSVIMMMCK